MAHYAQRARGCGRTIPAGVIDEYACDADILFSTRASEMCPVALPPPAHPTHASTVCVRRELALMAASSTVSGASSTFAERRRDAVHPCPMHAVCSPPACVTERDAPAPRRRHRTGYWRTQWPAHNLACPSKREAGGNGLMATTVSSAFLGSRDLVATPRGPVRSLRDGVWKDDLGDCIECTGEHGDGHHAQFDRGRRAACALWGYFKVARHRQYNELLVRVTKRSIACLTCQSSR